MTTLIPKFERNNTSVNRPFNEKVQETISVSDFGTLGTANDSAVIQAAIDSVSTQGGGILILPYGTYYSLTAINLKSNVIFEGSKSTIHTNANTAFLCAGTGDWQLKNLNLIDDSTSTCYGIQISSGEAVTTKITSCSFVGYTNHLFIGGGISTIMNVSDCTFFSHRGYSVAIQNGTALNSILFFKCNWENSGGGGAYQAVGTISATNDIKFDSCVIEAQKGNYAMDLGNNAFAHTISSCHFEANCNSATSADIHVGIGNGSVLITGNYFACNNYPASSTVTNYHNVIIDNGSNIKTSLVTNNFYLGNNTAAYKGAAQNASAYSTIFVNNNYSGNTGNFGDVLKDVQLPIRLGERCTTDNSIGAINQIVKTISTTNATTTAIATFDYLQPGGLVGAFYVTADVVGISTSGTDYGAFTVRYLISGTGASLSTKGTASETPIVSTGSIGCVFAPSNTALGTIYLNVTGLAATTIYWVANITINEVRCPV